jgi:dTDP-4-dehydrorhamnose reductase
MNNILVTGGNGQLGSELKKLLQIIKIITFYLQMLKI